MKNIEQHIIALRQCAKEHENDKLFTGQINVASLCNDTAKLLECKKDRMIIDVEFTNGDFNRGMQVYCIDFEPENHWNMKVYDTQEDYFKNRPRLYWGVKKITIVGMEG